MNKIITYRKLQLAFILFAGCMSLKAQLQSPGKPVGDFRNLPASDVIYLLPPLHPLQKEASMQETAVHFHKALKYAVERTISISARKQGVWSREEGQRVWRAHVISPGAVSVGLVFDDYRLEEGVKLMIYNPDMTHVKGAYTSLNNKKSGIFAVDHIPGEEVLIELQVPEGLENFGELSLGSISHAFLPVAVKGILDGRYGRSQDCEIDISCQEGDSWQEGKKSVVRINNLKINQYCTGVLLNNTSYNGEALILTANHCIESAEGAERSIFAFNYESSSCFGGDGSVDMSVSGAELLSTADSIDFTLVRLSVPPPENFDAFYAGWDLTRSPQGPSTCIHHPEGDVKKISIDLETPDSTSRQSQIPPQFWNLLSNSLWWVKEWDMGSTEPGSSGSPLFTPKGQLIGVLSFGSARCGDSIGYDAETDRVIFSRDVNVDDYYTRLGVAWDYYSDSDRSLKPWLDPIGSGLTSIPGLHPDAIGQIRPVLASNFSLWPNPAAEELWISALNKREGKAICRIFDLRGTLLMWEEFSMGGPVRLDLEKLPQGLYLLLIESGAGQELLKFVKSK